jgi:hypothetical protein
MSTAGFVHQNRVETLSVENNNAKDFMNGNDAT